MLIATLKEMAKRKRDVWRYMEELGKDEIALRYSLEARCYERVLEMLSDEDYLKYSYNCFKEEDTWS